MLTNEKIAAIHDNAVAHGFHDPDSEPTFGEYCALIHEEISEAFSAWRNGEPYECVKDGKPEGVWVELADVVIRCADLLGAMNWMLPIKQFCFKNPPTECSFGTFISLLHAATTATYIYSDNSYEVLKAINKIINGVYARAEHDGIDLDAIIERKHAYNVTRPWRHGKRM